MFKVCGKKQCNQSFDIYTRIYLSNIDYKLYFECFTKCRSGHKKLLEYRQAEQNEIENQVKLLRKIRK